MNDQLYKRAKRQELSLRRKSRTPFCNTYRQLEMNFRGKDVTPWKYSSGRLNKSFLKLEEENSDLRLKLHELNSLLSVKVGSRANQKSFFKSKNMKVINQEVQNAMQTLRIMENEKDFFEKRMERLWDPSYICLLYTSDAADE